YKVEGNFNASPDLVFKYVDPVPSGPRSRWDHAIKELQEVERFNPDLAVIRTITKNAFGGLISPRDFTDLVVNVKNDKYLSTNAQGVQHPSCPACSDFVRGTNHPCAIICYRVPGEPQKTRVVSYIQTDLSGMLPKTLVENALPSNQVDFFVTLKKTLQDDGHWMN
ncbi:hypothetical protein HELRODRAFT_69957, partial [Helobdella robusta]|uniref:START domain-containing protein n=1 Tax=Helobdella robusta TaxID=6412 RepID=T1G005_HELRO